MRRLHHRLTGLSTRVAMRTFLTFALCAVVPMMLAAFMSQRVIVDELRRSAASRLSGVSKGYGLLVYERLRQSDALLTTLGQLHLDGRIDVHELQAFRSRRIRIVSVRSASAPDNVRPLSLSIARSAAGAPEILLTVALQRGATAVELVGAAPPDYLWDADAVILNDSQICVRDSTGELLKCVGEIDRNTREPPLSAEWSLFLRPAYGVPNWTVQAFQSHEAALSGIGALGRMFPFVAAIAVALALWLSVVQIRRTYGPLALLMDAVTRLRERRFGQPVAIHSRDEFGRLGAAFNEMSVSVARQFSIQGALSRIDRLILSEPQVDEVLNQTLPALPTLLHVSIAAVLVESADRAEMLLTFAVENGPGLQRMRLELSPAQIRERIEAATRSGGALQIEPFEASACTAWCATPIRVDRRLRGVLLLGRTHSAMNAEQRRHARAFARRFAVALGAEERRRQLLRQAYYDELTGLPNRQLLKDRLEQRLAHANRTGECVALIYIDLDRFKTINDSLGHSAGDQLLKLVSERLSAVMRDADTLARLGGDEFVVIAAGDRDAPAHALTERLRAALLAPVTAGGLRCVVEASMGVAIYPRDGDTAELLLRNADTAMYRAKAAGGGCVVYFEAGMNADAMRRLRLEQRLRAALQRYELSLAFQPKLRIADGALFGVEALARWTDAELGVVSPSEFIPVAEECGLIDALGEWALREACTTYSLWRRAGLDVGHVGVNVSMRQLSSVAGDFNELVQRVLCETNTPAHALELEVTESMLAQRAQQARGLLEKLRSLGVRIAIDDFGVGYSSMAALAQLPTDALKIDRSFVDRCATDPQAASIVSAIISMAHALGKETVAEGVETAEQFAMLSELGCDAAQGFWLAHPMTAEQTFAFCSAMPSRRENDPTAACNLGVAKPRDTSSAPQLSARQRRG